MNDKKQLAAMGAELRLIEEQAKAMAERMPQTGTLQILDDEPLCTEIRINGVEACGADIGGLLDRCLPHTTEQQPMCMAKRIEELEAQVMALESRLLAAKRSWPDKCPITRRYFFMEIDGVPTYGGPYDSYTIPEMLGTPDQPWHDRELLVRRFDHDRGHWVDDEIIDLRVIHDGVLDDLLGDQVSEGWQLVPVEPTREMMASAMSAVTQPQDLLYSQSGWGMNEVAARTRYCAMLSAAPKPEAK